MRDINIANAYLELEKLASGCIKNDDIINIHTKEGNVIVMSEEHYNQMISKFELLKMLDESENDVTNGRVKSFFESKEEIKEKLK